MTARIAECLKELAEQCELSHLEIASGHGWTADSWLLSSEDVQDLLAAYRELLAPSYEEQAIQLLTDRGIDLDSLLIDAENRNDLVTRADMCELAAAASLLASGSWPSDRLVMPNIPKMSRRRSESGIDALATTLETEEVAELLEGEFLLLASVKHTLTSPATLRRDLSSSVSQKELTPVYVAQQLRVYEEKLRALEPTLKTERIFLFLDGFPNPNHVRIVAVAVVDPALSKDMDKELTRLPNMDSGVYTLRVIRIAGLSNLHEQAV